MKEKIINLANGKFVYEQQRLKIEPPELNIEAVPGELTNGNFIVCSCDERRVKGILYTKIPGLTFWNASFFGRAARMEFLYQSKYLQPGEILKGEIFLETSAGEYVLPVKIQTKQEQKEEEEETPLFPYPEPEKQIKTFQKGGGRSKQWKRMRAQQEALAEWQRVLEKERRNVYTKEQATLIFRSIIDDLLLLDRESGIFALMEVYVMLREGRREEAGRILRQYEKARLFQPRDVDLRALLLYVGSLYWDDTKETESNVVQLQKLYTKNPDNWMITAFLLELDPKLRRKSRTRFLVLEKQFRAGTRNRLLYQEAWELIKNDLALFTSLNDFTLQIFGWAACHKLLTAEVAQEIAIQAASIKHCSPLLSRLLKACYQVSPTKETAGAVCSIYIRGQRVDPDAFVWYQRGVELDAKITNLYEYFMYALPKDYAQLLPKQVILYFNFHNTLAGSQRTAFYCNLVKYGSREELGTDLYGRKLQEFLLKQLKARKINESLAWLYEQCLVVETLEESFLEALADLLFLRKLTCEEKRIRQVEVSYKQLEQKIVIPLWAGSAYIPVYTPDVHIALLDEQGRRYYKTVSYELKKVLTNPHFLQVCISKLKNHTGLNLYLLEGNGSHYLEENQVKTAYQMLEDQKISVSFRQKLKVEILAYERGHSLFEKLDDRLWISDISGLPRESQVIYIESMILLKQYKEALTLLKKTGCQEIDPKILFDFVKYLMENKETSEKQLFFFANQVFQKGIYTEKIVCYLAQNYQGSIEELLAVWKAGQRFSQYFPKLEKQILEQALFTENHLFDVFPVFLAVDDRGGEKQLCIAYLNLLGWLDFVKGQDVPIELTKCLEQHLLWEDKLAEAAVLCYLRRISRQQKLSSVQKKLVSRLLKDFSRKHLQFAFMRRLYCFVEQEESMNDRVVVEYRCNPNHKVILHYVLEYHGKKTFDYLTERLFPVCGGVFTKSFILFYGEKLTWFFTEEGEDGMEISTECRIYENQEKDLKGDGRYQRLCKMQMAADNHQEEELRHLMAEYEELIKFTETKFHKK